MQAGTGPGGITFFWTGGGGLSWKWPWSQRKRREGVQRVVLLGPGDWPWERGRLSVLVGR